uniref:histidine--tRNA ligase n=1 Tax=Choreocolax polysiphoniae TaxID=282351 RepID=A0A0B5VUH6_9FLOR|nr:histidine--tRNA ligase [Choreocolax polysiphoniae]AJH65833.1 histidine--tRNA ligase [Choreocolax polysiphoniae]
MQPLRGTKDILPYEIKIWKQIRNIANNILEIHNYNEIQTPLLEDTELFQKSIGNYTDIINKEMYNFNDKKKRKITLRPEGTTSVARAFISNKLYLNHKINKLWYLGPMFRYERPQKGRQRQFNQLGIECLGSSIPISDVEVIRLAIKILEALKYKEYKLEINSIGTCKERKEYKIALTTYLSKYKHNFNINLNKQINTNPLRVLDNKDLKIKEILIYAPKLKNYLDNISLNHFNEVCKNLKYLDIPYIINDNLVRGLDYYNYTAFEIKTKELHNQNTICGGGRYDKLIENLGGPNTPSVGWAMGIERLIIIKKNFFNKKKQTNIIYIIIQNNNNYYIIWDIITKLEIYKIKFELNLSNNNLLKQIKKANKIKKKICFILGTDEIYNKYITIKWLDTSTQQKIYLCELDKFLKYLKYNILI